MKRFLMLYSGPPTPPNQSHEGWPKAGMRRSSCCAITPLFAAGPDYTIELFELPGT